MVLKDRFLLLELMEEQGVSARCLADEARWKSHTYLQRLLRGEVTTLKAEPAARIAHTLGVPFNLLFAARSSEKDAQNKQERMTA